MYYTAVMVNFTQDIELRGGKSTDALFQIKRLMQLMMLRTNTSIVGSCLFIKCGQYLRVNSTDLTEIRVDLRACQYSLHCVTSACLRSSCPPLK